jgi:hypothetical protein
MRGSAIIAGFVLAFTSSRVASAGPDPYSPASTPPPPAFSGGYSPSNVTSSFVPRSPTLKVLGIAFVVAGGLTLVSAPIVGATSSSPAGNPSKSSSTDGAVFGLLISGVVLVAAGIPISVYGSTLVPPAPSSKASWIIEPAPNGLRFVF